VYVGGVDSLSNFHVEGWAVEKDATKAAKVSIEVDGKQIAVLTPTLFRQDLCDLKLADGYAGFRFYFPEALGRKNAAEVIVRRISTGEIVGSPLKIEPLPPLYRETAMKDMSGSLAASTINTSLVSSGVLQVTVAVVVPLDAELDVVPVNPEIVKVSDVKLLKNQFSLDFEAVALPEGAMMPAGVNFLLHYSPSRNEKYFEFDLVQKNSVFGRSAKGPAARFGVVASTDWLTIAPPENSSRTCGPGATDNDLANTGLSIACQMAAISREFRSEPLKTILDWGVGFGRVAIPFKRAVAPEARVIGLDVDKVNVEWCRKNVPEVEVSQCGFFPPVELPSKSIDLIYAVSVMTHLTEQAQVRWLAELKRILKDDGICILTATTEHSLITIKNLDPVVIRELYFRGISADIADGNLGPQLELKDYYRATYQSWSHIHSIWSLFFDILAIYPGSVGGLQDAVVMRSK
jgi:ubiquinone/menaquinone biosynthesis C-methylase UbiE